MNIGSHTRRMPFLRLVTMLALVVTVLVDGWSYSGQLDRRRALLGIVAVPCSASGLDTNDLRLKAPTEDQPQIPLVGGSASVDVVEGT